MAKLIEHWGPVLTSIEVIAGTGGVFDVDLDGERIFVKKMIGRYPEPEDVLPLITERLGPGGRRY